MNPTLKRTLCGLAVGAACYQRAERIEFRFGKRLVEIQVEVHALLDAEPETDDVFCIEACIGYALLFEEYFCPVQNFKNGHLRFCGHCSTYKINAARR